MFGELIGLWAAATWRAMESPAQVNLVELGPGRGTMMVDVLRAARVMPDFRAAIGVHLIEISGALVGLQRSALSGVDVPVSWHRSIEEVPEGGALIVLANEFFDALPIRQAVMCADGWHERVIKVGDYDKFHFSIDRDPIPLFDKLLPRTLRAAKIGEIFEWRTDIIALEIGRRVVRSGGAALIIDYGHRESAIGETLQAVGGHEFAEPLLAPGLLDLTAHVDFQALAQAAEGMGARVHGPLPQGEFLRRLGIEQRAAALQAAAPPHHSATLDTAPRRLTPYQAHPPEGGTRHGPWPPQERPRADATGTAVPGLATGVPTADCGPVLFADDPAGVIGVAHAGWRGAATGVLEATIAAMERCGATRARISVALGPTIRQPNYEVGPELVARFKAENGANERFFRASSRPQHALVDLPGYIAARLAAAGMRRIEDLGHCTYADGARFFSYRRSTHRKERDYGRHINAIALVG